MLFLLFSLSANNKSKKLESTSYLEKGFLSTFWILFQKIYGHSLLLFILILTFLA
jgi:hypothetical protein